MIGIMELKTGSKTPDKIYRVHTNDGGNMHILMQRNHYSVMACPECGSRNIEIVEGAIYQCEANHSGECQKCFCAWTID